MADNGILRMYTVYSRPRDFPDHIVLRGGWVQRDGTMRFDQEARIWSAVDDAGRALASARQECRRMGLFPLARHQDDDPVIVETWV